MSTKKKVSKKKVSKKSSKKVTKKVPAKKAKKVTIGSYCKELIMSGKYTREQCISMTKQKFKKSAVNGKHIAYYVWSIKKDGKTPPPFITED